MKIIQEGNPKARLWMVGAQVECKSCGQVLEIEEHDLNSVVDGIGQRGFVVQEVSVKHVRLHCYCCAGEMILLRQDYDATRGGVTEMGIDRMSMERYAREEREKNGGAR